MYWEKAGAHNKEQFFNCITHDQWWITDYAALPCRVPTNVPSPWICCFFNNQVDVNAINQFERFLAYILIRHIPKDTKKLLLQKTKKQQQSQNAENQSRLSVNKPDYRIQNIKMHPCVIFSAFITVCTLQHLNSCIRLLLTPHQNNTIVDCNRWQIEVTLITQGNDLLVHIGVLLPVVG